MLILVSCVVLHLQTVSPRHSPVCYNYPICCQVWLIKILKIKISTLNLSNLNNFFLYAKIPQKYKNHPKITIIFYHHLITIRQPEIPKMVKNHQKWAH